MNCSNCNAELTPEGPESDRTTKYQFDNALWIYLDGGYGMFIDTLDEEMTGISMANPKWPYKMVFCHECAHRLCDHFPAFEKLINPHNSHSHLESYHQSHPDHDGWDYQRRRESAKTD